MADATFGQYLTNYDQIARDDLAHSIQEPAYLKAQAGKIIGYLGNLRGLDVCEVGVGQGNLFRIIASFAPRRLVGIDISLDYLVRLASEGFEVVVCNAENLVFQQEFDVVVATDVLEHVLNVGDFLFSANRALKMGGRLLVRVPLEENLLQYAR